MAGPESGPEAAAGHFVLAGRPTVAEPVPRGHIHASWKVTAGRRRYLLQRLNTRVFADPDALMANLALVVEHIAGPVVIVPTVDGERLWRDGNGKVWRMLPWLDGTRPARAREAHAVAGAFGAFDRRLADLPPDALVDVLPHFHDPAHRLVQLETAVAHDAFGRARAVRPLVQGIGELAWLASALPSLPRRVAHHDAKADNVLVDGAGHFVAIVDLDTVMAGSPLWDAGDLVRSLAGAAAEDDADHPGAQPDLVGRVLDAFLAGTGDLLDDDERGALPLVGPVIAWEQAVRFLTDHLAGDVYFKVDRSGRNAERAAGQLLLTRSLVSTLPP